MNKEITTTSNVLMFAFRYSLGRHTGAIIDVFEQIERNKDKLELWEIDQMIRELEATISEQKYIRGFGKETVSELDNKYVLYKIRELRVEMSNE